MFREHWKFFANFLASVFFKAERAEYFRFNRYNEFLVTYKRFIFSSRISAECEDAIGSPTGTRLWKKVEQLRKRRVDVSIRDDLTYQQFVKIALEHSVLKNNDWVKLATKAISAGIPQQRFRQTN